MLAPMCSILSRALLLLLIAKGLWFTETTAVQRQQPADGLQRQNSNGTSVFAGAPEGQSDDANEVDIDALFSAVGPMPRCVERCTAALRADIVRILHFNNTLDIFNNNICKEYEETKQCIHPLGFCSQAKMFDAVASGLESLCTGPKSQFLQRNSQCIGRSSDRVANDCEQKCHFIRSLAQFSHRPDLKGAGLLHLLVVIEESGQLCDAANCFLSCSRDGLNGACSHSGGVILDGLLRPFYQLASFVQRGGTAVRDFVDQKVPKECLFLTKKESLDSLVNPEKI